MRRPVRGTPNLPLPASESGRTSMMNGGGITKSVMMLFLLAFVCIGNIALILHFRSAFGKADGSWRSRLGVASSVNDADAATPTPPQELPLSALIAPSFLGPWAQRDIFPVASSLTVTAARQPMSRGIPQAPLESGAGSTPVRATDAVDEWIAQTLPLRLWRVDPFVRRLHATAAEEQAAEARFWAAHRHDRDHLRSATTDNLRLPYGLKSAANGAAKGATERLWAVVQADGNDAGAPSANVSAPAPRADVSADGVRPTVAAVDGWLQAQVDSAASGEKDALALTDELHRKARRFARSRRRAMEIFRMTGCNVLRVPFDPAEDTSCLAFLSNVSNWAELRLLPAPYDARTLKFQLRFNGDVASDMHCVLKVPQRLFPYEAFAEIGAFHADRVLRVHRIPPTAHVCIPITMIRAAVARYGGSVLADAENLKDSGVGNYSQWVQKDLIDYTWQVRTRQKHGRGHNKHHAESEADIAGRRDWEATGCIDASLQPLFADVHHLLDSALATPYRSHNRFWHDYFNFSNPLGAHGPGGERVDPAAAAKAAKAIVAFADAHLHSPPDAAATTAAPADSIAVVTPGPSAPPDRDATTSAPAQQVGTQPPQQRPPLSVATVSQQLHRVPWVGASYGPALLHMAQLIVFDYIIGNNDRSPSKNHFVTGSCVEDPEICGEDERNFFAPASGGGGDASTVDGGGNDGEFHPHAGNLDAQLRERLKHIGANGGRQGAGPKGVDAAHQALSAEVDWRADRGPMRRPGPPSFVHIDQGMAFYGTPKDNPLRKALAAVDRPGDFCVFRQDLLLQLAELADVRVGPPPASAAGHHQLDPVAAEEAAVRQLAAAFRAASGDETAGDSSDVLRKPTGFSAEMRRRVPDAARAEVVDDAALRSCDKRIRLALRQAARCLETSGATAFAAIAP